ncbi:MAG: Flagellar basal-body rod protein FlgG, partial [uncultured Sphingomonadaceae bacterium]
AFTLHRRHGHARAADQRRRDLPQHRQHEHDRVQAAAGGVPGPALPERVAPRLRFGRRGGQDAHGHPGRRGRQDGGHLPHLRTGGAQPDGQPLRPRHPGPRLFPDHAAERRDRLHAGRVVPAVGPGRARHRGRVPGAARNHHPAGRGRRGRVQDGRGPGQGRGVARHADGGPASARDVHERGGARGAGRQPVPGDGGVRPGDGRVGGRSGPRHADAGVRRGVQRQSGGGDHRADHRAARVRDEQPRREDGGR